ncbi:DUF2207 domain-containing protein [Luteococcus sediminum]
MTRRWGAFWAALLLGCLGALAPQPAWAAQDSIDSWTIDYRLRPDGIVEAVETIDYRFGNPGNQQGITRSFVVREPAPGKDADSKDIVYDVQVQQVTSDDASGQYAIQRDSEGRVEFVTLRIGTPGRYIARRTASWTIRYTVNGALRDYADHREFSWDAVSGETPPVDEITVTAEVPKGVQAIKCSTAKPPTERDCTSGTLTDGRATWVQRGKMPGEVMTVSAKLAQGAVAGGGAQLVPRADADELALQRVGMGAGLASLVASPVLGLLWWRRRGRDLRFVGLPPGVVPGPGERVAQKPSGKIEIPVAFSPPKVSVAEAGLLVDGVVDTRETTATLVDLAVRGVVQLANDQGSTRVALVDPSGATEPHEQVLLNRLFAGTRGEIDLAGQGSMHSAHEAMVTSVRNQVAQRGWFTAIPSAAGAGVGCSGVLMLVFVWFFLGGELSPALWLLAPVVPLIITSYVVRRRLRRGQRTGLGRAITDQVEGFRTYLATAEAEQLRFEEGEDIFSRYLPWAIMFGLADRWADLCAELVRMGRLSAEPPVWYYGPYDQWNFYVFTHSLNTIDHAATPAMPAPTSIGTSGTGFGGPSAFGGGGGFSGSGGGGGGIGSW